jgi:protein AFG1
MEDTNESIMAAEALSETLHQASYPNISVYNPGERLAREKKEREEGKRAGAFGVLGIWTGEDERFAYVRFVVSFSFSRTFI